MLKDGLEQGLSKNSADLGNDGSKAPCLFISIFCVVGTCWQKSGGAPLISNSASLGQNEMLMPSLCWRQHCVCV